MSSEYHDTLGIPVLRQRGDEWFVTVPRSAMNLKELLACIKPDPATAPATQADVQRVEGKIDAFILHFNTVLKLAIEELETERKNMDKRLQSIADAIAAETAVEQKAVALLDGLAAQLSALSAAGTPIPAADIQALADQLNASKTELAAAVTRDTPPAAAPATPGV